MVCPPLVALALLAAPPWDQLQPLEDEIAALQLARARVTAEQGAAERDRMDRRVALLRRAHARTVLVVQRRVDVCLANLGGDPPAIRDATEQHLALFCAARVGAVAPQALELEEIKERLATQPGTLANHDARRALQARVRELEASL